ncbi:hypothetical protein HZH66_007630 [Vespula vulgaris]|uniref:Uncharacterized protein n=1 Tax=Vespula vulgaris TaxID=7454 RepID=A0A834N728_VESVU|nr:hypothetical protein HZH66_007630 [Vespula vulgaris]
MEMTVGRLGEEEDRDPESPCKTGCLVASRGEVGTKLEEEREDGCRRSWPGTRRVGVRRLERRALAPIWVELSRSTSEKKDRIHDGEEFERSGLVISLIISDVDRSRVRFCPMEADGQRARE